jgi:hypothetical protein
MLDTNAEIQEKQREIIFSKSPVERFLIGAQTIDFGRIVQESSIKNKIPLIGDFDLKVAVFKQNYEDIFSPLEIEKIMAGWKIYTNNHG